MRLTRRGLLASAAGGLAAAAAAYPLRAVPRTLRAMPGEAQLAPDGEAGTTAIWGYDGGVPGPELRMTQGERFEILFENGLPQPSTVHWHGLRIDNAMDGAAHLTQPPVAPGESFRYAYTPPDAGTFWYHPHNRTWEQMARGLYGPLIVEEREPVAVDRDIVLMLDDWRLDEDAAIDEASFGALHDWSHAGRLGNWPTVNGTAQPDYPAALNERLRLRLINAANATVLVLRLDGLKAQIVAHDGMPVEPEPLSGEFTLAPSQRIDLIADATGEGALFIAGRENFRACGFPLAGTKRQTPLNDDAALPPNPLPESLDIDGVEAVELRIGGGAMGAFPDEPRVGALGASYRGEDVPDGAVDLDMMIARKLVWTLNGTAGMPLDPLVDVPRGATVRLRFVNEGRWPHAMHLHGHHFRELRDGAPWRDTLLVGSRESREIAFRADNPGDWMLHCHMLEHQAGGMGTWIRVG